MARWPPSATARAAPDGMTLMMTTNTPSAANPALMKKLDYDPVADFTAHQPHRQLQFLAGGAGRASPFRNVADLLAAAKAKPGRLTYASGNSTGIVAGGAIAAQAGVEMTHVPYRSTPPAITDVVAGRVSCMVVDVSSSHGQVKGGQLRVLGVTTKQRSKLLPDIPPLDEVGLPGFDVAAWAGLIGPARMPPGMVASINADVRSVWDRPETVKRLADIGFDGFSSTPDEFAGFIKDEIVKWGRMARAAGIEPE